MNGQVLAFIIPAGAAVLCTIASLVADFFRKPEPQFKAEKLDYHS